MREELKREFTVREVVGIWEGIERYYTPWNKMFFPFLLVSFLRL